MSGWTHAGIVCDGCGEQHCAGRDTIIATRQQACLWEGWSHVPQRRPDGRHFWRDLCASCGAQERGEK